MDFIHKFTALSLVVMGALLVCGIFIQYENAHRPMQHMTCKTVKAQHPEGDWTCVIWENDPREADKYFTKAN